VGVRGIEDNLRKGEKAVRKSSIDRIVNRFTLPDRSSGIAYLMFFGIDQANCIGRKRIR